MKNNNTVLGLSIAIILAISVVSITTFPDAFAKKPIASGQPDFVANFETLSDPDDEYNGQSFSAKFWVEGENGDMRIAYKIVLNKIDVGEVPEELPNFGQDGNGGKGLTHYLEKLHIHPAPVGDDGIPQHDATVHYFNIVGPADDDELEISGKTLKGIWDSEDENPLPMPAHESVDPYTVIGEMCSGDTDVNVHLQNEGGESHLQVRGQIYPNSEFCSTSS